MSATCVVVFCVQDGTDKNEILRGGVVGSNGTYVLAGYSDEDWNGINAGGGSLVFKVDAERDIIWNLQVNAGKLKEKNPIPTALEQFGDGW